MERPADSGACLRRLKLPSEQPIERDGKVTDALGGRVVHGAGNRGRHAHEAEHARSAAGWAQESCAAAPDLPEWVGER